MDSLPPFARVIKEQRERLHLSRSQLAEKSELSYPYISQLETGLRKPSRNAARAIANALGLNVEDLERTIPGDTSNVSQVEEAQKFSDQLMSGPTANVSRLSVVPVTEPAERRPVSGDRDDLIGDIIDLLEEFDSSERLDVLAEVQKRAMQRMMEQRDR